MNDTLKIDTSLGDHRHKDSQSHSLFMRGNLPQAVPPPVTFASVFDYLSAVAVYNLHVWVGGGKYV